MSLLFSSDKSDKRLRLEPNLFSMMHLSACCMQVILPVKNFTAERFYEETVPWKAPQLKALNSWKVRRWTDKP